MLYSSKIIHNFPSYDPMENNGKLFVKVVMKNDYQLANGTFKLYLQVFLQGKRKRLSLDLFVLPDQFDAQKQRVTKKHPMAADYNLYIEKKLSEINTIEMHYRLAGVPLSMERFLEEFKNPSSRLDFIQFWEMEMVTQKELIKKGTYKQQMSALNKLRGFKESLFFLEFNDEMVNKINIYLTKRGNSKNTINTFWKNCKKYLQIARKRGVRIPLDLDEVKVKQFRGDRTYLTPDEIRVLFDYWNSIYIQATEKFILARFLFSCFTGLRYTDNLSLGKDNFIGDMIVFVAEKTGKMQKITLNESAKQFVEPEYYLGPKYSNEFVNRELKQIAKRCAINKNLTFHVSRHTFATNYLLSGGSVQNLQVLLAHSKIDETMLYVHIVESMLEKEILSMDNILKVKSPN